MTQTALKRMLNQGKKRKAEELKSQLTVSEPSDLANLIIDLQDRVVELEKASLLLKKKSTGRDTRINNLKKQLFELQQFTAAKLGDLHE